MYIVYAILAFSALIIIHELGHFTLAKLNNAKVEVFSIGMGPKILSYKGKETEYTLCLLPIGGYVKILGEDGENANDDRSFASKNPWQKLSIVSAGAFMNFVLAIVIFSVIAMIQGYVIPTISKVDINTPAMNAGLISGDKLLSVDNHKVLTWQDFSTDILLAKGNTINLAINRNGVKKNFNITPIKDVQENRFILGVYPSMVNKPNIFQSVSYSFLETGSIIKQSVLSIKMLFTGQASFSDMSGPVSIIRVTSQAAKSGILNLLGFTAYISVALAIFQILPIPALDGGWMFLFIFEIITGKKVDDKKIGFVNTIGFALLFTLMIAVTIKDIIYPLKF